MNANEISGIEAKEFCGLGGVLVLVGCGIKFEHVGKFGGNGAI